MKTLISFLLCLLALSSASQTLYKWVDEQGRVSYSDLPPPPQNTVKDVSSTLNTMGAGAAQLGQLNYETQTIVKQAPITVYTSKGCAPCDQGRALLMQKGYPFSEKIIVSNADVKALQALLDAQSLPVLSVGKTVINGYGKSQWEDALSEQGYSDIHRAPSGYVNPAAHSLTVAAQASAQAAEPTKPSPSSALDPKMATDSNPASANAPTASTSDAPSQTPNRRGRTSPASSNSNSLNKVEPVVKF